jgi:hypothetical protein
LLVVTRSLLGNVEARWHPMRATLIETSVPLGVQARMSLMLVAVTVGCGLLLGVLSLAARKLLDRPAD